MAPVLRPTMPLAFGLAVLAGSACAKVENPFRDAAEDVAEDGGLRVVIDGQAVDGPNQCKSVLKVYGEHSSEILILLDRSESMGSAFDGTTRLEAAQSALIKAVSDSENAATIQFTYELMPGDQKPCALGCCDSNPSIELADDSAADVVRAISATTLAVGGKTPTAAALWSAWNYFAKAPHQVGSEAGRITRYVLLVTDGEPDCSFGGEASSQEYIDGAGQRIGACSDAVTAATNLNTVSIGVDGGPSGLVSPVQVPVVGLGPAAMDADSLRCLDEIGLAGGAVGVTQGTHHSSFIGVENQRDLEDALDGLFKGMPKPVWKSCEFRTSGFSYYNGEMKVRFNDVDVPKADIVANQDLVRITGTSCDYRLLLGKLPDGTKSPVGKVEIISCPQNSSL